jgi:late competence protein required for DNA uptake (superfamily II DNA/RNA helicase)
MDMDMKQRAEELVEIINSLLFQMATSHQMLDWHAHFDILLVVQPMI